MCKNWLKEKLHEKFTLKTLFGIIATGLLAWGIIALVVNVFQWSSELHKLLYFIIIPILFFVYLQNEKMLYVISALLIVIIGFLIIFISGEKCVIHNLPWDPSLFGIGVSIVAMAFTFLSFMFPPKVHNANIRQVSIEEFQKLETTLFKLDKSISLIKDNVNKLKKTNKEILRKITDTKIKVVVQKGKK